MLLWISFAREKLTLLWRISTMGTSVGKRSDGDIFKVGVSIVNEGKAEKFDFRYRSYMKLEPERTPFFIQDTGHRTGDLSESSSSDFH